MVERILQLRKALGLSQEEFSAKIGISRSGYSDLENRRTPVQERHIRLILSAFPKVSESWLRSGSGSMFNETDPSISDVVNAYDFPDIVRLMLEAFDELDEETKKSVTKYTRDFLTKVYENYHAGEQTPGSSMLDLIPKSNPEIDAETNSFRQHLVNQAKMASSQSSGTEDTAKSS